MLPFLAGVSLTRPISKHVYFLPQLGLYVALSCRGFQNEADIVRGISNVVHKVSLTLLLRTIGLSPIRGDQGYSIDACYDRCIPFFWLHFFLNDEASLTQNRRKNNAIFRVLLVEYLDHHGICSSGSGF